MRIKVCIPFYSEFEFAKPGLQELLNCKEHEFVVEPRQGVFVGRLRNGLIAEKVSSDKHQLPEKGFDAFLTIDSDIGFTLKHVLKLISHDKDIVGSPYLVHDSVKIYECGVFKKYFPGIIVSRFGHKQKGFKRVDWMGSGMMLIKSHVFGKWYPWYRHRMIEYSYSQEETGEDIGFCIGAANAGFDIWCDFDNPVQHKPRSKEDFNTDIHNIHKPKKETSMNQQQQNRSTLESLSEQTEEISRQAILMNDQYKILLGKAKTVTGEVIDGNEKIKKLEKDLAEKDEKITSLEKELSEFKTQEKEPVPTNE